MPIISADMVDKKVYRITVTLGHGMVDNVVVTSDGTYDVYYIKDCKGLSRTGRIVNVVQNRTIPQNSYILFDWSEDNSSKKERIYFHQIQYLKDVTPNNAYQIALEHGFVGSITDWLESMKGDPGKSAYELAVECGFEGTQEEYLESMRGYRGYSAYEIALQSGFIGTQEEWLESLKGKAGKSAYDIAVEKGFVGTEEEWFDTLQGRDGVSAYELAVEKGFEGTEEEWLDSLQGANGLSAYEIAVKYGFEGTEEEWLATVGDTTVLQNDVAIIKAAISWVDGMGNAGDDGIIMPDEIEGM